MDNKISPLTLFLEAIFPQLAVNRRIPSKPEPDQDGRLVVRWRWVRHPLQAEQRAWVAAHAKLYWLHWFFVWAAAVAGGSKLGPPGGAILYLGFTALAGWTLPGLALASALERRERKRQAGKMRARRSQHKNRQ